MEFFVGTLNTTKQRKTEVLKEQEQHLKRAMREREVYQNSVSDNLGADHLIPRGGRGGVRVWFFFQTKLFSFQQKKHSPPPPNQKQTIFF